jgi:hypothetical protein
MSSIPLNTCTYYAFTDPASGRSRAGSSAASIKQSKQAITVCAVSPQTHIFCVFAWLGKLPTTAYVDKLLKVHSQYTPRTFGIEANAMQSLFADQVRSQAKQSLQRVAFLPISQPTNVDKKFRIRTALEPVINYGRLFLLPSLVELENAIQGFPVADNYLDLIDCLASTVRLIPRRPDAVVKNAQIEALAKYLRDSGAPSWQIERRIAEERAKLLHSGASNDEN